MFSRPAAKNYIRDYSWNVNRGNEKKTKKLQNTWVIQKITGKEKQKSKNVWNKQKKWNKMIDRNITTSIITLSENRTNIPIKRQMQNWVKKGGLSYVLCISNKI